MSDGGLFGFGDAEFLGSLPGTGWCPGPTALAFARTPLYAYSSGRHPLGLSTISDQQLAAGVMWVPGSLVYAAAACWALYSWLDPAGSQRAHRPAFPSSSS